MGKFNRNGKGFGGKRSFGRGSETGGPKMHSAVCDECGSDCELPFKPAGNKPVYCSSCFDRQNGRSGKQNKFGGGRRDKKRFEDRKMFDAVCDKCGSDCQVPFKPTEGKEIFCDSCFGRGKSKGMGNDFSELSAQIQLMNKKIDTLVTLLMPKSPEEVSKKDKQEKKEEKKAEKNIKNKKALKKEKKAKPAKKKSTKKK